MITITIAAPQVWPKVRYHMPRHFIGDGVHADRDGVLFVKIRFLPPQMGTPLDRQPLVPVHDLAVVDRIGIPGVYDGGPHPTTQVYELKTKLSLATRHVQDAFAFPEPLQTKSLHQKLAETRRDGGAAVRWGPAYRHPAAPSRNDKTFFVPLDLGADGGLLAGIIIHSYIITLHSLV